MSDGVTLTGLMTFSGMLVVAVILRSVISTEILKAKLEKRELFLSAKHRLPLASFLSLDSSNELILEAYFFDLNLLNIVRVVGFMVAAVTVIMLLVSFTLDREFAKYVLMGDAVLFFLAMVLEHRRERLKDVTS